jgi:hypothetical protein
MHLHVAENTEPRLRLALRSSLPLYVFFGLMFVALGLWCIRLLAVEVRVVVEQQRFAYAQTCVWVFDCGRLLADARDISAVTISGHGVEVRLPDGVHRLAFPLSEGVDKAAIGRDIAAALAQPGATFRHEEGQPVAGLLLGLVCLGSGLLILSATQWVSLDADRRAGTLRLTRRLLVWPWAQAKEFQLADIETVLAVPSTLNTGRHVVTSHAVRLRLRALAGGTWVGITFLPMFTEADATDLARTLRNWLGSGT